MSASCVSRASFTSLFIAAAVLLAPACASQSAPANGSDPATGELVLPLTQTGASGTLYVLSNAAFQITDATGAMTTVEDDGSASSLSAEVPPGIATIELLPGWTLQQSHDGGVTLQPVNAQLASLNPQTQRVLADTTIQLAFDFIATDPNGTLQIALGVDDQPNKLVGGYNIGSAATGDLAAYANVRLDFAFYFGQPQLTRTVLPDGSKSLQYSVFSGNLATPAPVSDIPFAAAFFNDPIGTLAGPIAAELAAGSLNFVVSAAPDGTLTLSGEIQGGNTTIEFGPSVIDIAEPPLDANGFPTDAFFDAAVAFTQTSAQGTLAGSMQMRHALPGQ